MSLRLVSRVLCDHDGCHAWCEVLVDLADVAIVSAPDGNGSVFRRIDIGPTAYDDFPGDPETGWWHDREGRNHFCPEHRNDKDIP